MKFKISCFLLLFNILLAAQSYRLVKVSSITPLTIQLIQQAGIDLENAMFRKDGTMEIPVSAVSYTRLLTLPVQFTVLIPDLASYYASRPALTTEEKAEAKRLSKEQFGVEGFGYGSMAGYYTFTEIAANLDSMFAHYPNLITQKFSIGTSHEGRQIWAAKISDNPNSNESEPHVYYDALIHAREPQSMAVVMYFMWYLLENYGSNPEVTYLVNNREFYFVPCFNPDGYTYNQQTDPQGGGMWRLNRRVNSNGTYGVDLNRNFGYKWGYDDIGSSPTPGDETYRGPSAFSEPETQSIRNFLNGKQAKTYINYHSYNNSVIYPWGYANAFTPDSATFVEYASYMVQFNGFDYGNSYQTLGYVSNGTARDWGYGEQQTKGKAYSYTFEVGNSSDGFWPSQSRILPLAQDNLRPNLFQGWISGGYPKFESAALSRQYFMPNDTASVLVTLKNKGLSSCYNISLTAEAITPGVTVLSTGGIVMDSLQARTAAFAGQPIKFKIAGDVVANQKVKLMVKTAMEGIQLGSDTVSIVIGMPTYLLRDSANTISNLWTVTASPTTPKWETTTASFVSGPSAYTDSKTGVYANNATVTMVTTNPINLTGYASAKLTFSAKWDIEKKWDCMVVQVSTDNGSVWTSLAGAYTIPASGSGKQVPAGMPCYDGINANWVNESIDLSAYANKQIKLRFELRSDGSQQKDGVFLDDIGIVIYTLQQQPTTSWTENITIKDAGNVSQAVTMGTAATATDGIDVGLGEITLPPLPPSGVFDTRFELPVTPAEFSAKDLRNDTLKTIIWNLKFQPGLAGYPVTLSWDSAGLPQGTFIMKDAITGTIINLNMKQQSNYTVTNAAIGAVVIEYSRQLCADIPLAAGWNMVSVPVTAASMATSSVFANATSQVYGFANGYTVTNSLENGKGYWVRYGAATTTSVCGNAVTTGVPVLAGWNMIGAYDKAIPVSGITSTPANIVNSVFYGFANGYAQATTLSPGKGYWVRVSQNGTLNLPATTAKDAAQPALPAAGFKQVSFTDATGISSSLYFVPANTVTTTYALPPVPPTGLFDARFVQGAMVSTDNTALVSLSSPVFPVVVSSKDAAVTVQDAATHGKVFARLLAPQQSLALSADIGTIELVQNDLPKSFALEQNYPNPFNPATTIRYQLPVQAKVVVKIFDGLGTEVATLVNETQPAGYHQVEFNANRLSSGVYYYTLNAGGSVLTRKMLLLK